jgi:hypothetical protein
MASFLYMVFRWSSLLGFPLFAVKPLFTFNPILKNARTAKERLRKGDAMLVANLYHRPPNHYGALKPALSRLRCFSFAVKIAAP